MIWPDKLERASLCYRQVFCGFYSERILKEKKREVINEILKYVGTIEGVKIYRKELWSDIKKLFSSFALNPNENLISLARKQIEMYSVKGCRQIYNKTISRPFLIKGLEFNHAILLDADTLKPKELYVALTRGSNYLTILSEKPVLRPNYSS